MGIRSKVISVLQKNHIVPPIDFFWSFQQCLASFQDCGECMNDHTFGEKLDGIVKTIIPSHSLIVVIGVFIAASMANPLAMFDINTYLLISFYVFLDFALNTYNACSDVEIDKVTKPFRPIPCGIFSKNYCLRLAIILYFITLLFPLYFLNVNILISTIMFVAIVNTFMYSFPYLKIKKFFVLSNISIAVHYGLFPLISGWFLFGTSQELPLVIFSIIFFVALVTNITKDFEDFEIEKELGIRTIPVVCGVVKGSIITAFLLIFPYVTAFLLIVAGNLNFDILIPIVILTLYSAYICYNLLHNPYPPFATRTLNHSILLGIMTEFLFYLMYSLKFII